MTPNRSERSVPQRAGRARCRDLARPRVRSAVAIAGEGGTSHVMPGANATLVDLPPTSPGGFFKPMYINYQGDASAKVPTAAGVVANLNADANTLVLGGGYGFEQTVLGGAHYSVAAFLPYTWLSISGNSAALGGVQIQNSVSGIGDLTVVPVMLGWKSDNWQYDFLMPVYAPTGSYETGRLGNTGLNYWTFDPIVGVAYSNAKSGLTAAAHLGYAINTENNATSYKSGNVLHLDTAVQQIFPLGSGFANIGARGLVLPAGHLRQRSGRDARLLQGTHRRHRAGAGLHPADRHREAALRVQVAAGAGDQESPEGRLPLAEDGLHVLTIDPARRTLHATQRHVFLLRRHPEPWCLRWAHRPRKSCRSRPRPRARRRG